MALIECKECRKQVSSSAAACPHCGAKVRGSGSLLKLIVIAGGGVILLAMIVGSFRHDVTPSSPSSAAAANGAGGQPVVPAPHWTYTASVDSLTQKPEKEAAVESVNELNFGFPYQGSQHAVLSLRIHPRFGKDVLLSIDRGQFLCDIVDGCTVTVRFDGRKPQQFSAAGPSDHSTTVLFIRNYDRFLAELRKSKKAFISAEFFQEGNPVIEFDTNGLKW